MSEAISQSPCLSLKGRTTPNNSQFLKQLSSWGGGLGATHGLRNELMTLPVHTMEILHTWVCSGGYQFYPPTFQLELHGFQVLPMIRYSQETLSTAGEAAP